MTIYGKGIVLYVQQDVLVDAGMVPLSFAVDRVGSSPKGKVAADGSALLGDVNNDGRVNISDALVVATYGLNSSITPRTTGISRWGMSTRMAGSTSRMR